MSMTLTRRKRQTLWVEKGEVSDCTRMCCYVIVT